VCFKVSRGLVAGALPELGRGTAGLRPHERGRSGSPGGRYPPELDMQLRDIAHARTGDRGVLVNVSVIAFDARDYPRLERIITADRVRDHLAGLVQRTVVRYA